MHAGYSERVQLEELTADMTIVQNTWQQMWTIRSADMMWSFFFMTPANLELTHGCGELGFFFLFFFSLVRGMRATQCASKFRVYSALQNNGGTVKKNVSQTMALCVHRATPRLGFMDCLCKTSLSI